jgi:hypothetical protein
MIKEVEVLYEMNSEIFDAAAKRYDPDTERNDDFQMRPSMTKSTSLTTKDAFQDAEDGTWKENTFPTLDVSEVFRMADNRGLIRRLILHLADISNPTKPFRIARIWAFKICEEFHAQGDAEKALGLPVQNLNDREKNNRAFSQVGFIEFLVAPLAFVVVKVMFPYDAICESLLDNLKRWQENWVQTSNPVPSTEEQKALDGRIEKLCKMYLGK